MFIPKSLSQKVAYNFAVKKHEGQFRKFIGIPYINHPMTVAKIVEKVGGSEELILTALLHDTLEDTDATYWELRELFGITVADLVVELTTIKEMRGLFGSKKEQLAHDLNEMSNGAFLVKLADRISNISDVLHNSTPKDFFEWYMSETVYIISHLKRKYTKRQKVLLNKLTSIINANYKKVLGL
jgi:GTP diphosphokinase / guanosine-3',5'-bis(diphosphate) 3'-diphosphatase